MTEFVTNNNEIVFTNLSPYFATKYSYSYINFDMVEIFNTSTYEQIFKQKIFVIIENI